jgi:PAS domain S-box-containing protein
MIFSKRNHQLKEFQQKISALEERLLLATQCLEKISNGSFDVEVEDTLKQKDEAGKNFMATLQRLSGKLKEYSEKEDERKWIAEGVSKFMDLTRSNNQTSDEFYDKILSQLVRYTGANQGGIFILNDQNIDDKFLELTACYAYGKKKFLEKRVDIGQGMLGQCFLEKETTKFTHIPDAYVKITSGLGEATPDFLLLVPMKHNEEVLGIIEIASFNVMEAYKIEFIERIAENIASLTLNMRNAQKVEQLFKESQQKAKMLQEQEEELRQNLEELVSTQEEMKRNQKELDQQTSLLKFILDNIPFPVFVKDEVGRYILVNKAEAKLFNQPDKEIIGKDDSHFVASREEWKVIRESDARVMASDEPVELPLQFFTTTLGAAYVFKTTKVPFINNVTGKKNILGVSIDLTEKLDLEKKLFHEKSISGSNLLMNIIGRQRMLSQKIGFYAETLIRGKKKNTCLLHDAIELFEHSLQIIRYGGIPMGVASESPLPECDIELLSYLEKIEHLWSPYKQAAEKILYFYKPENILHDHTKLNDIESSINFIEDNSETMLKLNNELMLACIAINQNRLSMSVVD